MSKVSFGIEEELIIINKEDRHLAPISHIIVDRIYTNTRMMPTYQHNCEKFLFKISEEPRRDQIEYATNPLSLNGIRQAMCFGRDLLEHELKSFSATLFYNSTHPYSNPNPLVGVHVHVSIPTGDFETLMNIYNHLWNYMPEMIAMTKNSRRLDKSNVLIPSKFITGKKYMSTFLGEKGDRRRQKFIMFYKDKPYIHMNRMLDMAIRGMYGSYDWYEVVNNTNRIELRIFDIHKSLDFVMEYLKLIEYLVLEAIDKDKVTPRDNRERYYWKAINYPYNRDSYITRSLNNLFKEANINEHVLQSDRNQQQKEMEKVAGLRPI